MILLERIINLFVIFWINFLKKFYRDGIGERLGYKIL